MNTKKQHGSILLLAVLLLNLLPFGLYSQGGFDALRGDGLDFSQGFLGWKAMTGSYDGSSATAPNWNWGSAGVSDANGPIFTINTNTTETDPNTGNGLRKIPDGYIRSVKLKNENYNTTGWAGLQYTMEVSSENCLLTFNYAMVLQAPGHEGYINPTFQIDVMSHNSSGMTNTLVDDCAF